MAHAKVDNLACPTVEKDPLSSHTSQCICKCTIIATSYAPVQYTVSFTNTCGAIHFRLLFSVIIIRRKIENNCFFVSSFRRKPCLILRDILKTELGKAYLERIRRTTSGNRGQVSSTRKEHGQCKEEPIICRDRKSSQRMANNDSKSVTPKYNQKTTSSSSQR